MGNECKTGNYINKTIECTDCRQWKQELTSGKTINTTKNEHKKNNKRISDKTSSGTKTQYDQVVLYVGRRLIALQDFL